MRKRSVFSYKTIFNTPTANNRQRINLNEELELLQQYNCV